MTQKPNILYFVADQMRADAQHYLSNPASITQIWMRWHLKVLLFRMHVLSKSSLCSEQVQFSGVACILIRQAIVRCIIFRTTGNRTFENYEECWL